MNHRIFLVRHADYSGDGEDPSLSEHGKQQSVQLAERVKQALDGNTHPVTIWSSSAKRAHETAQLIKQEMPLAELVVEEKLWSDNSHRQDFPWLKQKLEEFDGKGPLVIVSHLEYVRQFPSRLGFNENRAGYAEGVMIHNGQCLNF